jgi:hypothetical protein
VTRREGSVGSGVGAGPEAVEVHQVVEGTVGHHIGTHDQDVGLSEVQGRVRARATARGKGGVAPPAVGTVWVTVTSVSSLSMSAVPESLSTRLNSHWIPRTCHTTNSHGVRSCVASHPGLAVVSLTGYDRTFSAAFCTAS